MKFCTGDFLQNDASPSGKPVGIDSDQIKMLLKNINMPSVMVILEGLVTRVQILDLAVCVSLCTMSKLLGKLGFLENSEFKPVLLCLKNCPILL